MKAKEAFYPFNEGHNDFFRPSKKRKEKKI